MEQISHRYPPREDLALGEAIPARYINLEKAISLGIISQDSVITTIC